MSGSATMHEAKSARARASSLRQTGLVAVALTVLMTCPMALAQATLAPLRASVIGNPGKPGIGPVIDSIEFDGNSKVSTETLRMVIQLRTGTPLSASVIQPELDRITDYYRAHGGAYVQPSLLETSLNHAKVIFLIREGVVAMERPEEAPPPEFFKKYFGNTLICAATQTNNDLCHMWFESDGTFLIIDANGAYTGTWKTGKVRADGRVPICRYWDLTEFELPAELRPAPMVRPAPVPAANASAAGVANTSPAPRAARICETRNFRTTCTSYPDVSVLSPELQRKAARTRLQANHDEGSCYSHGPHEVGDAWWEWDNHSPGQLGLDREILLPGRQ
jgi:hypothetical protein